MAKKKKIVRKTRVDDSGQEVHEDHEVEVEEAEGIPGVDIPHPGKCPTCGRDR